MTVGAFRPAVNLINSLRLSFRSLEYLTSNYDCIIVTYGSRGFIRLDTIVNHEKVKVFICMIVVG